MTFVSASQSEGSQAPVALYITSPEDKVGAFTGTEAQFLARVETAARNGLTVDTKVFQTLAEIAEYLQSAYPDGVDQLHFRGHGTPTKCTLTSADGGVVSSELTGDHQADLESICKSVRPGGILATESCNNGLGKDNLLKFLARHVQPGVFVQGSRSSEFSIECAHDLPNRIRYIGSKGDESRCYFKSSEGKVHHVCLPEVDALWNFFSSIKSNFSEKEGYDFCSNAVGLSRAPSEIEKFKGKHQELIKSLYHEFEAMLRTISLQKGEAPAIWTEMLDDLEKLHASDQVFTYEGPSELILAPRLESHELLVDGKGTFHNLHIPDNTYVKIYLFLLGCAYVDKYKTLFMMLDNGERITATSDNPSIRLIYALSNLAIHPNQYATLTETVLGRVHRQIKECYQLAKQHGRIQEWFEAIGSTEDPCFDAYMEKISEFHFNELHLEERDLKLKKAIESNDLEAFRALVEEGIDIYSRYRDGRSICDVALLCRSKEMRNEVFALFPDGKLPKLTSMKSSMSPTAAYDKLFTLSIEMIHRGLFSNALAIAQAVPNDRLRDTAIKYVETTVAYKKAKNSRLIHPLTDDERSLMALGQAVKRILGVSASIKTPAEVRQFLSDLVDADQLSLITHLDLNDKGLQSVPPEILFFPNLTHLNLSGNQLIAIPPEIRSLTHLQEINLSHNELSEFPHEICHLLELKKVNLNGNLIGILPSLIEQLTSLESLSLCENQFERVPLEAASLPNLRELVLSHNWIKQLSAEDSALCERIPSVHLFGNPVEGPLEEN
ncbi:MAG: leucine-rich repeat domain-containing protein [Parachlamydiales bacterium]|nr:leucine-rich repeat domain-containing protein [Verrucomicrobiota bacterium]MBX3719834.1 leucine-rich repeat domain-containing protein [Candidatus Acheromyda pituitae]